MDSRVGTISALPRRNGNYTLFLLADDSIAGSAPTLGLPLQLDQVIVKRWTFAVLGKPDFVVTQYARQRADALPALSSGGDPYITRTKVGSIICTVGTMYHIAPVNQSAFAYDHASGGVGAKIRFTIRNPPPGFFIEPSTGEVQGNPQAATAGRTYASTLLAIDPAGQEAVLETMTFTILPKPQFQPIFGADRTTADDTEYTDPMLNQQRTFVVGTSYKIATFVLNTNATKVSAGSVDDITYTLSADAPESFCVQAKSGDISGTFPTPGNYSFAVLAVDQAGGTAVAEQLDIAVYEQPVFAIAVGTARVRSGIEFADPAAGSSTRFVANESYRFSRLELLESATTVSSGTFDDITFTLIAGDGWFVSAQTGEIFGQFASTGTHSMTLYAVDNAGKQAEVETLMFDVQERPVFKLASNVDTFNVTSKEVGLQQPSLLPNVPDYFDTSTAVVQYAVGSTIKFPALQIDASELFVNPAFGDFGKVTYKRTFGDGTTGSATSLSPGLWLVDTETAEMLAQPERPGNYSVNLVATDGAGAEAIFRSWSFEVLYKDTDVPKYGPNGKDCLNGGNRIDNDVGGTIFDRRYECGCEGTGYEGSNCENAIPPTVCGQGEALVGGVCKSFQLATNTEGVRTAAGSEFTDPRSMETKFYTVREFASYMIAPLVIDDARTNYSSGNQSDVTYTMSGDTDGFFLNTQTGQMLGTFDHFAEKDEDKSATKQSVLTLQAIDKSGIHQDLETIVMNVRYPDLEVDAYGPNGKPCENNGTRSDGVDGAGDPFDQSYVCKCIAVGTTVYSGDNCEVAVETAASTAEGSGNTPVVAGVMAGAVIFIFCIGLILYKRRMYQIKMKAFDFEAEIARLVTAGEIDEADEGGEDSGPKIPREIKRANITMIQMIGEGAFGEVWKAVLDESQTQGGVPGYQVAVKTSKEGRGEGAEEMLREATVMAQVSGHPNLVSLIGVVTSGVPLLLAISMCENGSLLSMLKDRKLTGKSEGKPAFTTAERIKFGIDTAKGMAHLTASSFVHRDLAARNVLVDALMNCKVADFGLARGIAGARAGPGTDEDGDEEEYYRSRTGTFPVRWTSPEAMQTMRFSEATDVWSFGIVLIEIFTDGGKPYAGMANAAVISKVQGGYRAEQPTLCTDAVYAIMLKCWMAKPADRPTFVQLASMLGDIAATGSGTAVAAAEPAQRHAIAVNDTYMTDEPPAGSVAEAAPRHAIAVNDTYMTDEPAAGSVAETAFDGDQYLTLDTAAGAGGDAGEAADDEYLTVAAGLHSSSGLDLDGDDSDDFEC